VNLLAVSAGVFLLKYSEGFFDLAYGRLQQERRMSNLGWLSLLRAFVSVPVFYVAYVDLKDLGLALVALSVLNFVFYIAQSSFLKMAFVQKGLFDFSASTVSRRSRLVIHLFPFAISTVMMALVTSVPRLLLEHSVGPAELGRFAAVAHFVAIGSVVVGSMTHAIAPTVASAIEKGDKKLFWTILFLPAICIQFLCLLGILLSMFLGDSLVTAIYGSDFSGDGQLLVWAAVAAGPVYFAAITGVGCYVLQAKRAFFSIHFGGLIVISVVTLLLVASMGAPAAFMAMALCGVLQVIAFSAVFVFAWQEKAKAILC
jgi:O-antigen/teichoic acid export membrane protein